MTDTLSNKDYGLLSLLNLDGVTFFYREGYWVKFKASLVEADKHTPHGIRYSLSLHDKRNTRIVGYDNAHGYQAKRGRYKAKKVTWDHIHKRHKVQPYEFDSAGQLIEDFWNTVSEFI